MEKRNNTFACIYLILAVLCFVRGILAAVSGQDMSVTVLRFGLGIFFLIVALLYRRRK